jgi:hypothetical protein
MNILWRLKKIGLGRKYDNKGTKRICKSGIGNLVIKMRTNSL